MLSDKGEPYCEIQSGRFVHQGVHRLMPPRAVETWNEAWFPVWGIGGVVHASDKIALNAQRNGNRLKLHLFPLAPAENATLTVTQGGKTLERTQVNLSVGEPASFEVTLHGDEPVSVALQEGKRIALQVRLLVKGQGTGETKQGAVVADYSGEPAPHIGLPEQQPSEPTTVTDWLLRARDHEERNELDAAADCYRKALSLDPKCVAAMNGLAQWHLKRGEVRQGLEWAQKALQIDPQSEDALWWKAVASYWDEREAKVARAGKGDASDDPTASLWALTRSNVYAAAALALLGEFALRRNDYQSALDLFARALERNPQDSKVLALAAFAARKLGDAQLAQKFLQRCEQVNPIEPLLWSERHFLGDGEANLKRIFVDDALWLDVACDYGQIGAWGTVSVWVAVAKRNIEGEGSVNPMLLYHAANSMWRMGKLAEAMSLVKEAQNRSPLFVFPHRHEDAMALKTALTLDPNDLLAHYLLGTWLASVGRWDEAARHWKKVTDGTADETLKVLAWRNVGLMQRLVKGNLRAAEEAYNEAVELVSRSLCSLLPYAWRLWFERDIVLVAMGEHEKRVRLFETAPEGVRDKPQIAARWAEACVRVGDYAKAVDLLSRGNFKPWEGEFELRQLWKEANMQLGHQAMSRGDLAKAREHFEAAADYPPNLNVGRPHWTDDADALFWAGWCALKMGDKEGAKRLLEKAATENQPPNAQSAEFKAKAAELLQQI